VTALSHGSDVVQREIRGAIGHVLTLVKSREPLTDDSVHEIRKQLKRARAALRLIRDAVAEQDYARENGLLRDAARPLSPVRDAAVLLEVVKEFERTKAGKRQPRPLAQIRDTLLNQRRRLLRNVQTERTRRSVCKPLEEAHDRISRWRLPFDTHRIITLGLKRIYRKARKSAKIARTEKSDQTLHEARKQAKYLATATQILDPDKRGRIANIARAADKVAKRLGDDHDLSVFLAELPRQPNSKDLAAKVAQMRRKLREKALKRTQKLYKAKTKAFVARLTT